MKRIHILLAFLALGMLFFGCTTSTEYSANYSANGSAGATPSGGGSGAAGSASSGAASGSGATPATGSGSSGTAAPPATEPSAPPPQNIEGKTYSDLLGAGSASRCTVTYFDESAGSQATLELYFSGANRMRIEQPTDYPDCPTAVAVYKGDSSGNGMLYLTCPGHESEGLGKDFMTDDACAWRSMDIEEQYGGVGASGLGISNGYMTPSLEYLPEPIYSCRTWTLDASKFETPGYVCG